MMQLQIYKEQIAVFCQKRHIRWLMVYGSVLGSDFRPDENICVLVKFEPKHVPGLFGMTRMVRELSALFDGRMVDLRTTEDLSQYSRQEILEQGVMLYEKK